MFDDFVFVCHNSRLEETQFDMANHIWEIKSITFGIWVLSPQDLAMHNYITGVSIYEMKQKQHQFRIENP